MYIYILFIIALFLIILHLEPNLNELIDSSLLNIDGDAQTNKHVLQLPPNESFNKCVNCKTTLLLCTSPHIFNRDETINSMRFGSRCKMIKNKAKVNKCYTNDQLKESIQPPLEFKLGASIILNIIINDPQNINNETTINIII